VRSDGDKYLIDEQQPLNLRSNMSKLRPPSESSGPPMLYGANSANMTRDHEQSRLGSLPLVSLT